MFKNMKVKRSLLLGFSTNTLISITMLVLALFMLSLQNSHYQSLINTEIEASDLVVKIRMNANIAARLVRDMALAPGDPKNEETKNTAEEALQTLAEDLKKLEEIYPLNDGKVVEYRDAITAWEAELPNIIAAINAGQGEEAIRLIHDSCTPRLNAMATLGREMEDNLFAQRELSIEKQNQRVGLVIAVALVVMIISALMVFLLNLKIIKGIVYPVEQVRVALRGFREGDFTIPVDFESKNELGDMSEALRDSQHVLSEVISDICRLLEEMSKGNFDIRSKDANMYVGGLSSVLTSVRAINYNLSDALSQITVSAEQVAAGADQVSSGAQALAQGATEQASAVEELSATIAEISQASQRNAGHSQSAMRQSEQAGAQVAESSKYMDEMVEAMTRISEASQEIGKIIDTIENIAFQTNILALNAAVEAARAGSAGKGFAVVADEVRNLASKSDEAAKATKDLIDHAINSVQQGGEIVMRVSDALNKTVELAGGAIGSMEEVAKAVSGEADAIRQITTGIDQISSVVQTNSATSEESAAASEELSSQASIIKELMQKFKLRKSDGVPASAAPVSSGSEHVYAKPEVESRASHRGPENFSKY